MMKLTAERAHHQKEPARMRRTSSSRSNGRFCDVCRRQPLVGIVIHHNSSSIVCTENSIHVSKRSPTSATMIALCCLCLAVFVSPFKWSSRLYESGETRSLQHQLVRTAAETMLVRRFRLTDGDRLFLFASMYRWFPTILRAITIVRRDPHAMAPSRLPRLLAMKMFSLEVGRKSARTCAR